MRKSNKEKPFGTVYIVSCTGSDIYKIGCTRPYSNGCWHIRYKTGFEKFCPYQMELLLELQVPNYSKLENELHKMFDKYRMNGEFFKLSYNQVNKVLDIINREHKNID